MKAVFILPNLGAGGAERVTTILSKAFVDRGIAVDIVLFFDDKVQYAVPDGVRLVSLNTLKMSKTKRIACLRKYFAREKKSCGKVTAIPFQDNCLQYALTAAVGLGVKVIACERNDPYQKGIGGLRRFKECFTYALADRCVFQTPDARDYYWAVTGKKSQVISNPLVLSADLAWQGQASRKIMSVGRLQPQKNQKMMIDAFVQVHKVFPDYTLEIYGEGDLRESLERQIRENGLDKHVFLRGYASDIHEKLTQAAMFVMPSDYEGMSNALMEALAIGVPTVSTDHPIGGAKMLIEDGISGILTPVGDGDALAKAMIRVLSEPEQAQKLSGNACKVRKQLEIDAIAQKWLQVIQF